jgi:G3E family GTPase
VFAVAITEQLLNLSSITSSVAIGKMSNTSPRPSCPPVTLLAGFLGAGKTTLLQHLLTQAAGRRWAVVVNDVATINIDGAVVTSAEGADTVVQLENGCVCCSSKDDLGEGLIKLAREGAYEHIFVEASGVAEPRVIAQMFVQKSPFGPALSDFVQLANLVTVVDVSVWADFLREARDGLTVNEGDLIVGGPRPLSELLVEQIECADVVVLNQCDRAAGEDLDLVRAALAGLNARATVIETERGQVPSEVLVERVRFSATETLGGAAWIKVLNAMAPSAGGISGGARSLVVKPLVDGAPRHEARYGLRTVTFQVRRPFCRAALKGVIERGVPGLVRAKGFIWWAEQPDEMGFLSFAGGVARWDTLHPWWAAMIEAGRATRDDLPPGVRAAWVEPAGDRRQELVFIGVELDEKRLREQLEACLV